MLAKLAFLIFCQVAFYLRIHTGYPPNSTNGFQRPEWMKHPIPVSGEASTDPAFVAEGGGIWTRWLNATVGRSACRYTRVANLYPHGYQQDGQRPVSFRILEGLRPDENPPFAITADEGILYVSHPESLSKLHHQASFDLLIGWDVDPLDSSSVLQNASAAFRIDIIDSNHLLADSSESVECDGALYCAKFRTESGCNQVVGSVATDQRGCAWRRSDSNTTINGPSRMYQTCSPDLSTCPDGYSFAIFFFFMLELNASNDVIILIFYLSFPSYCDELESLSWEICPQDCTGKKKSLDFNKCQT